MARVAFTSNLRAHVDCPPDTVGGSTAREVLDAYFGSHPAVRSYVLDDQGAVRKHVTVYVNGDPVLDRTTLADPVAADAEVYVMQALSGG